MTVQQIIDEQWMSYALQEAKQAEQYEEVPIGSVIVYEGDIIATAHNQPITSCNPVAHAEILVMQQAAKVINNYRLVGCDLYCTLEPCIMCAGAIVHSRINRLIFGAFEPKAGSIISNFQLFKQPQINHRPKVTSGILESLCAKLMTDFFNKRRSFKRQKNKKNKLR